MNDVRERVARAYHERWGTTPDRVLFAPGRINLIGDHTDYSLLPVLPMAIQRGIAFAIGDAPEGITVDSLDEPSELRMGAKPARAASWHRYAEFAAQPFLASSRGVRVLLAGDLPSTGGLSSSSALVVGLLAAISANGPTPLAGRALVEAAVAAERRAAIEGGEMDQTVIVYGEAGHALRIDFDPPATRTVALPPDWVLLAADSGQRAAKGAAARAAYNARVVGGRCASALLAQETGRPRPTPLVLGPLADAPPESLQSLPETGTASEVAKQTETPLAQLVELTAGDFPAEEPIPIRPVARHVLAEAAAVEAAERALLAADLDELGRLLNTSHESLRSFGSSTDALDALTAAMRDAGALGARVTGAGFGGYAIALCRPECADRVLDAARRAGGGPAFRVEASKGIGGPAVRAEASKGIGGPAVRAEASKGIG